MQRLPTGSPHFKGVYRQHRQSDYNLKKALCEFVDNPIMKCNQITVRFRLSDQEKGNLSQLIISDDYLLGFEHMFQEGISNPFNMTHMRPEQDEDDEETSQFGIGMKAGAISTGCKLDVFTKVDGQFYWVEMDFPEMCERDDDSFSPNVRTITEEEYRKKHPFENGSTLVLSSIHQSIYVPTTKDDLKKYLITELSNTYNDIIKERGIVMKVNDDRIHGMDNIYEARECIPFTKKYSLYFDQDEYHIIGGNECCCATCSKVNTKECFLYNPNKTKSKTFTKGKMKDSTKLADLKLSITTTITMFNSSLDELPYGRVDIFRNGRKIGCWKDSGSKNNGGKNYTVTRIDISRKEVAKKLGLTFNKNVSENNTNIETTFVKSCIEYVTQDFNSDISTPQYKKLFATAKKHNICTNAKEPSTKAKTEPKPVSKMESNIKPLRQPLENDTQVTLPEPVSSVTLPEPIQEPLKKTTIVSAHIKGSLTDEQLDTLLSHARNILKTHPAMIRAFNEIVKP